MKHELRLSYYTRLSLHIIIVFTTAILVTFIPDYLHGFFGDTYCKYGYNYEPQNLCILKSQFSHHPDSWHWGIRHWIYSLMTIVLFIIQLIKIGQIKK
jgi:hypothetical protein